MVLIKLESLQFTKTTWFKKTKNQKLRITEGMQLYRALENESIGWLVFSFVRAVYYNTDFALQFLASR